MLYPRFPASSLLTSENDGKKLEDSSTFKNAATIRGKHRFVNNGRFKGALRLEGKGSAIITPVYNLKNNFTAEGWFKAEGLSGALITFVGIRKNSSALTLSLLENGCITAVAGNTKLTKSEAQVKKGQWFHVAVAFESELITQSGGTVITGKRPKRLVLYLNGRPFFSFEGKEFLDLYRTVKGQIYFGNSVSLDSPFNGLLDELRISHLKRTFLLKCLLTGI